MSVPMIDVSSNNHSGGEPINWHAVTAHGVRAVMIKATESGNYVNPWLDRDAHGARAAGLLVGYYHFAQPQVGNAAAQADYALSHIKGLPNELGLALDLETRNGLSWPDLATWAQNFLAKVAGENVTSPIYLNTSYLDSLPGAPFGHKLWLASWGVRPRRAVWAWQYSGTGTCPGVPGECDLDTYYG